MSGKPRILVVDDKENMLRLLERILGDAHEVVTAEDGTRALSLLASRDFDLVLSDIRMPGADGFEVLQAVKSRTPETEVVLMTAFASVPKAVEAMRQGAYDYLQKPFDPDDVALIVSRALERKRLREQGRDLRKETRGAFGLHRLVGKSTAMQEVNRLIERAAAIDITVLLTGESGTGKELAARAIHYEGARKGGRFVAVNCGALPAELVESELFGNARGASTGAAAAKPGLFEEAQGGSIFLDEIGDVPLPVQVKLNRALQDKEIRRVGESAPVAIDARIIAATHRDLKADAQSGRFREDLFYRLSVFPIRLPSLRDRREDVPLLAAHFLETYGSAHQRSLEGFDPEALRMLAAYDWSGNVRELENAVERAVAVATGPQVTIADLPAEIHQRAAGPLPADLMVGLPYREAIDLTRDRASREYLTTLLKEFRGNVTRAAERAGMERESLHRLLKRYGVHSDEFKRTPPE
jgi:DNA-binding NtrC family response regulator